MKRTAALIITLIAVTACASSSTPRAPRTVPLDREFELRIGETANLDSGRVNVTFVALVSDSRCPGDVTCIHEGNAEIELLVTGDEGDKRMSLNTNRRMAQDERYGLYRITMTQLVPYPRTDRPIEERDYGATLVISRG